MINQLRSKIAADQFEFSKHALDQSILRGITVQLPFPQGRQNHHALPT